MIRIERPAEAPAALNAGVGLVSEKSLNHDADPAFYTTHKASFAFDPNVYGDQSVRDALKVAQHWKCCFCESKIEHIANGEVEHFRPKAAWRQDRTSKLIKPGYYWLAYSWDNLLWSCNACNARHKKNLFPLREPAVRNCPGRSTTDEDPMLVDPSTCDPRDHIRFKFEVAIPVSDLGEVTIEALGLNRERLLEERRGRLQMIVSCWNNVRMAAELNRSAEVLDAQRTLDHAIYSTSPYSSMAIDLIDDLTLTPAAAEV